MPLCKSQQQNSKTAQNSNIRASQQKKAEKEQNNLTNNFQQVNSFSLFFHCFHYKLQIC